MKASIVHRAQSIILSWVGNVALLLVMSSIPFNVLQAQEENAAFYIYQNDGHFDGFFYDEVQKISYSFLDTLGIEHPEVVSQEIVTADSTYRIMLSAIDSVGFVQPEIVMSPNLYEVDLNGNLVDFKYISVGYQDWDTYQLVFHVPTSFTGPPSYVEALTEKVKQYIPKVGNIYVCYGEYGWAQKIVSIEKVDENEYLAICEDVTDIGEIFTQFVGVEEYGYNAEGEMVRRRVAGRPDLNIGQFSKKASSGGWEGDIFNFSLSGHYPLYDKDDLTISIDPTIEGKLNIKAVWDLSLWGDKYIGITSTLNFGVGAGFSVDGKISDFFPGGIGGLLSGVPIPASCPLFYLDIAPDMFLRGEAHVKFTAQTPSLKASMWSKLEIKNWIPSMSIGFGNPDKKESEWVDKSSSGLSLELNGYVQAGMLFPLKIKSLPLIKKIFDSEIGGQWFVGPKLAGSIALDLTTMPWNDVATYTLMKNTRLQLHMLDADYEVKGTIKTAFTGKKEVTLADGSINIIPPYDVALVPEFADAIEYTAERVVHYNDAVGDSLMLCHIYAFEPSGGVIMPVNIGTTVGLTWPYNKMNSYYHIWQLLGQPVPQHKWAEFVIPYHPGNLHPTDDNDYYGISEAYDDEISPVVNIFGRNFVATPSCKIHHGPQMKVSSDTLIVTHDFNPILPIKIMGNCEKIISACKLYGKGYRDFFRWLKVTGTGNVFEISVDPEIARWEDEFGTCMNYSPVDTLKVEFDGNPYWSNQSYVGIGTIEKETFATKRHNITVWALPNRDEAPFYIDLCDEVNCTFDGDGWECTGHDTWIDRNYLPITVNGYVNPNITHKKDVLFRIDKEIGKPWQIHNGSYTLTTTFSYIPDNPSYDENGNAVSETGTVTETCNFGEDAELAIVGGLHGLRYQKYLLQFTCPVQVTKTWGNQTTTYSKNLRIDVGWYKPPYYSGYEYDLYSNDE